MNFVLKKVFLYFFLEIIAVLKGHTGLVKGVSWDPVGKYIASQVIFFYRNKRKYILKTYFKVSTLFLNL